MENVKRKARISIKDFCGVFTKRKFSFMQKIMRKIYVVEDMGGNYCIEEVPTILGNVIFVFLLLFTVLPVLIVNGMAGVKELAREVRYIGGAKPLREDPLFLEYETTKQIFKLIGWVD